MNVSSVESFTLQQDYGYLDIMTDFFFRHNTVVHISSDAWRGCFRGTIGPLWFHARDGILHFSSDLSQTSQWSKTSLQLSVSLTKFVSFHHHRSDTEFFPIVINICSFTEILPRFKFLLDLMWNSNTIHCQRLWENDRLTVAF